MILQVEGDTLHIQCTFAEGQRIKREIPFDGRASGWSPRSKTWTLPATPGYYERLKELFDNVETNDSAAQPLAARAANRRYAHDETLPIHNYKTQPWEHQVAPIAFTATSDIGLLHMHMGTGKTKVVFDTIAICKLKRILVLCPKAVIPTWKSEEEKHGDIKVHTLNTGSTAKRAKMIGPDGLYALNYEAAWQGDLAKAILAIDWDMVVFDESHRIKSHTGKASKFCARIKAAKRFALTGTPMPHSPLDIFGQYRALDPGIFGDSWTKFQTHYAQLGGYAVNGRAVQVIGYRNEEELKRRMDKIRIEVRKDALTLPPLQIIDFPVTLAGAARWHYDTMENLFIAEIESGVVTASNALSKLLRLQQITSGFLPLEGHVEAIGEHKAEALETLLEDMGDEPCVVFCRFRHDLDVIRDTAKKTKRKYSELSGRHNDLETWRSGVIGVQIQAGAEGVDLTRARYAIYYSLGYSLGQYEQSIARLHRPGQEHPVTIYRLLCQKSVDEKVAKALEKRKCAIQDIMNMYGGDHGYERSEGMDAA